MDQKKFVLKKPSTGIPSQTNIKVPAPQGIPKPTQPQQAQQPQQQQPGQAPAPAGQKPPSYAPIPLKLPQSGQPAAPKIQMPKANQAPAIQAPQMQPPQEAEMAETPQPQKPPSQSSRLRLLKPQEQDAAKEAEAYPAYRKSPPPEGLAESEQEEASFPQHPPAGQTLQEQAFVRPPPGAKTSVMQGKLINRPPQSEETIENYKEQLQNYLELCDSLSDAGWTPDSIIDVFYVMIQSLDLDTVALALLDFSTGNSFMPVAARGFKNFPGDNIVGIWNQAVGEGPSVDWNKLMVIASGKQGDLSKWISIEGLDSIGYVPIHDSRTIFGFIFIGTHDKSKPQSGIASSLLELCGSRMGLVVALRRLQGTWN